jgi:hypothetical protein
MNDEIEDSNNIDMTVDNGYNKDPKVKQHNSARTDDSKIIDITKSDNTSKGILDIADTPDVAVWNKSVQIKPDVTNKSKNSKEKDNGETQTTGFGFRKGRRKEGDDKDSAIIDPANQKDIDDVVNSGCTLTDKA